MKIRDAEQKDASQLDTLLTALIHDETQYDPNLDPACTITGNYCGRIGAEGHKLLVAEEDGKIAGYLYGFLYHIPGIWKEPVAILDALYVEEHYRRRGCASALFSAFQAFAKENSACRIELKVLSDNGPALEFYKSRSFKEAKKYMNLDL